MFLIWTHTHLCIAHTREREISAWRGAPVLGLVLYFLYILYRGIFARFSSPWGFPRINLCVLLCGYACLSFNNHFSYGYVVMMLNVIIYGKSIQKLTNFLRVKEIFCKFKNKIVIEDVYSIRRELHEKNHSSLISSIIQSTAASISCLFISCEIF